MGVSAPITAVSGAMCARTSFSSFTASATMPVRKYSFFGLSLVRRDSQRNRSSRPARYMPALHSLTCRTSSLASLGSTIRIT